MRFYEVTYGPDDDGDGEMYPKEYFVRKDDAIRAAKADGHGMDRIYVVEIDRRKVGGIKNALLMALNRDFQYCYPLEANDS